MPYCLPHIPLLSLVFYGIGFYLLPLSMVLLWFLTRSRKARVVLLTGLIAMSVAVAFLEEACHLNRPYPWDCMMERIYAVTLLPLVCLLGYVAYVYFCTCLPERRAIWKMIGFAVLGVMLVSFEYLNVTLPVLLLAGYASRRVVVRKYRRRLPVIRKWHALLATLVLPVLCLAAIVCAVAVPPPKWLVRIGVRQALEQDMNRWRIQKKLVLKSFKFQHVERMKDGLIVHLSCETNMGPAMYRAFCNNYGGYVRAECTLLNR